MRILQINSVCGIGSTGRIATDIHAILKEQGHESYIAFGRGIPISCDNPIRIGYKCDIYAHVVKTRIFDKHGFGSKRATKEIIAKIKELDPDVIHLHNIHGYYINVEILFDYIKELNKPIIWTLHDCWPFTGHCTYFDFMGCNCWKGESKCTQKRSYPASYFLNNSKNNYYRKRKAFTGVNKLTIVTPSKWLANLAGQSFLNEYPIRVINNGIDLSIFKPTESRFRRKYNVMNKFIILGVANTWDRRKGLSYFIDLAKKITSNEVIVLVGITEEQKSKLPDNIIGISKTNNIKELVNIYSASDVFVNPTLEDNFPTTNLEALACGTPVITFMTGGSVESLDKDTGIIVEKGNIHELLKAINKIKEKGKEEYYSFCLDRANNLYNKDEKFKEYLNLYMKVIL